MPQRPQRQTSAGSNEKPVEIQPPTIGSQLPRIQVNLQGIPVNLVEYFQTRKGLIFGILDATSDVCLNKYLKPFRELQLAFKDQVDFVGCVVPNEPDAVRACARALHVGEEITFISDVRRKFFSKFGALRNGDCRRFVVVVDVGATFQFVMMDEMNEAHMEELRACLQSLARRDAPDPQTSQPSEQAPDVPVIPPVAVAASQDEKGLAQAFEAFESSQQSQTLQSASQDLSQPSQSQSSQSQPSQSQPSQSQPSQSQPSQSQASQGSQSQESQSDSDINNTPRTQALINRRRTTAETSKWLATLLTSSTRHTCVTNASHDIITRGYSYKDVCFEYSAVPLDVFVSIGRLSVEIIPHEAAMLGNVYHRGGTYRAANLHLHAPADHQFKREKGVRPLELFVVHELTGGRGEKTPLVYSASFQTTSADSTAKPNATLNAVLEAGSSLTGCKGSNKVKIEQRRFSLNSLLVPNGDKLIRYIGNLKLLGESVTWIVRQSPVVVPLEQMRAVLAMMGATEIHPSSSLSIGTNSNIPSLEELFALSFAPFSVPHDEDASEESSGLSIAFDKLTFIRECSNVGLKLFSEAMAYPEQRSDNESNLLLLLLDSYVVRLQQELGTLNTTILSSINGTPELKSTLVDLEVSAKELPFHPVRRSLFERFLDLEATEWLSPALIHSRAESCSASPTSRSVSDIEEPEFEVAKPQRRRSLIQEDSDSQQSAATAKSQSEQSKRARLNRMIQMAEFMTSYDRQLSALSSFDDQTKANTVINKAVSIAGSSYSEHSVSLKAPPKQSEPASSQPPKTNASAKPGTKQRRRSQVCESEEEQAPVDRRKARVSSASPEQPDEWDERHEDRSKRLVARHATTFVTKSSAMKKPIESANEDSFEEFGDLIADEEGIQEVSKHIAFKTTPTMSEGAPDWEEAERKSSRFSRIKKRRPTGHPHITKRLGLLLNDFGSESEEAENYNPRQRDEDHQNFNQRGLEDQVMAQGKKSQALGCLAKHRQLTRKASACSSKSSRASRCSRTSRNGRFKRPKKSVALGTSTVVEGDETTDAETRATRIRRISSRKQTGHPGMRPQITASMGGSDDEDSDEDDREQREFSSPQKTQSVQRRKAKKEHSRTATIATAPSIIRDGDEHWEDETRHQTRFSRIQTRKSTGHPAVAKKVNTMLAQMQLDQSSDSEAPTKPLPKKKGVTLAPVVTECADDGVWSGGKRASDRFERIQKRRPTGHPAMKDKVAEMTRRMEEEDEEEEEIRSTKPKRSSHARFREPQEETDGDSSWNESDRRVGRSVRINTRKATGHPLVTKKLKELLEQNEELKNEELKKKSILRAPQKTEGKKRAKKACFASDDQSEENESDWGEISRQNSRTMRLQRRRPTGHPSWGKKMATLLNEAEG